MQNVNPYQKYQQQSVMTMTQGEMLTKLLDEVIKQLTAAGIYIEQRDIEGTNRALQKAQAILNYLREHLNPDVEISKGLDSLYEYFVYTIIQANVKKDVGLLAELLPMVTELKETMASTYRATRPPEQLRA